MPTVVDALLFLLLGSHFLLSAHDITHGVLSALGRVRQVHVIQIQILILRHGEAFERSLASSDSTHLIAFGLLLVLHVITCERDRIQTPFAIILLPRRVVLN